LLWFIATYAPDMESWERDIFLAVREESFYFYPVFRDSDHERRLGIVLACRGSCGRPISFPRISTSMPSSVIRTWCDRSRRASKVSLSINPYHLGFTLWEEIIEQSGMRGSTTHSCARMMSLQLPAQPSDARGRHRDGAVPLSAASERPHSR